MNDDFKLLRTSADFLPADIPQSFWDVIEQAGGDSIKLRALLAPLEQERLYEFYKTYFEARLELPYQLEDEHGDAITGATEDTLEDLAILKKSETRRATAPDNSVRPTSHHAANMGADNAGR